MCLKCNFLFLYRCEPINQCILNPCNFETEVCDNESGKCLCKPGYELLPVPDSTDGEMSCQQIPWENLKCNVTEACKSNDPNMNCLAGPESFNLCVCSKGFKREGTIETYN